MSGAAGRKRDDWTVAVPARPLRLAATRFEIIAEIRWMAASVFDAERSTTAAV
jgi:hypothetical protein